MSETPNTYNPELEKEHPWGKGLPRHHRPRKPREWKHRVDLTRPEYNVTPPEDAVKIWTRRKEEYELKQTGQWTDQAIADKYGLGQSTINKDIYIYKNYLRTRLLAATMTGRSEGTVAELTHTPLVPMPQLKVSEDITEFTKALGYQDKPFHHEWYELANNQKRFLLLAPRSHAKSTCLSINYILWRIARNPNIRILLVSNTDSQAKRFVYQCKVTIEREFPLLVPDNKEKWAVTEFIVRRDKILKDATLSAVGVTGAIISRRADLIICDDVVDNENASSEQLRDNILIWLKQTLLPALEPDGQIIFIGTPFGPDDLYATLIHDHWPYKRYDAIVSEDEKIALWPERVPYECPEGKPHDGMCCLMEIRKILGSVVFNAQYRCDASGYAGRKLKIEWLQKSYYRTLPENLEIVMGVDPAISKKTDSDYFAIAVAGYSASENKIYVVNFYRGHYDFPEQLAKITDVWQNDHASRIIVETVAYQEALYQGLQGKGLPVIPYKTVKDKVTRIMNISPYFENKTIRVKEDMDDFIDEYVKWDGEHSKHDDLLDALTLAVTDILDRHTAKAIDYKPQLGFATVFKSKLPHLSAEPLFSQPAPKNLNATTGEPGKGKNRVLNFATGVWEWQ